MKSIGSIFSRYEDSVGRRRLRTILFHGIAVIVVLSPLVVIEALLRLCVPAPAVDAHDPYVSFSGLRPLFVLDDTGRRFVTAQDRLAAFCAQSFSTVKDSNTVRIFCLGGSTVQGHPYSAQTSFTAWLELNLCAARPQTNWEVVNCGGVSYASYRLVPLMRELLGHEPDLFILCTGHNEFLEDRTYGRLKKTPRILIRLHHTMLNLRSYDLADHWLSRRSQSGSRKIVLSPDVHTMLDTPRGLESYRRDDARRQDVVEHFHHNLQTMIRMSRDAGVPVILVNPVCDLKDCPPFKSEFRAGLSQKQRQHVLALITEAQGLDWADAYGKIELLEQGAAIDSRHAGLLFQIGTCYRRLGRCDEAKTWFLRAKEEDVCPLRIIEPMHEAILSSAARNGVPLVDASSLIEGRTADGIPGAEWLLDHVHPTIEGHQLIADALYRAMEAMELVQTPAGWQAARDELRRRHLASLNDAYFAHGAERLKHLQQWSRGRIPAE